MAPEPSKFEILRSIRNERRRTLTLLRDQPAEAFDAPATPGWRVRDVVAHLITLDRAAVTGSMVRLILWGGTDRIERWNDRVVARWSKRPVPTMLVALDSWGRRFERQMSLLPKALYRMRFPTIWGRMPGAFAVWIRAYDEFVHRQDIRRALGLGDDVSDATAIAEFLLSVVPYHTLPELAGRGGTVALEVAGEPLPRWRYDAGSGGVSGPVNGDEPADVVIRVPATPFIMAAAGREDFAQLESSGMLTIKGDSQLAGAFLSKLRLV